MTVGFNSTLVSIIVCTYKLDNYDNLTAAIDSLLAQSYPAKEILVVVDGNQALQKKVLSDYGTKPAVRSILLKENRGVSEARNAGIKDSKGDILVFMDDDAVAAEDWLDHLLNTYREFDALSVGGKILPVWPERRPDYFPEELDWLVGATNDGFAEDNVTKVRNTFGPNMSFKREVFQKVGLFNKVFGFIGHSYVQAEEPELALRMKRKFGKEVMYNPKAVVYHKITPLKLKVVVLLKRSFFQGYSKALLRKLDSSADSITTEKSYLKYMLTNRIPYRIIRAYHLSELKKVVILLAVIINVGLGFIYGNLKRRQLSDMLSQQAHSISDDTQKSPDL
jgi:glucosyl-dolichyl phosphate glucuronosyltransferase